MYILRPVLLVFVTCSGTSTAGQDNEAREVIFVNVLHRHGQRTPTHFYPNAYKNLSYWPEGIGQLTILGRGQAYELGLWLRKRYDSLLTELYSPDIIYIQSTDVDRTIMSTQCVLAGMFPPKGAQVWSEELAWQPIPVHTTPLLLDKVLAQPPVVSCPAFDEEVQRVFTTDPTVGRINQTYSEIFTFLSQNTGKDFTLANTHRLYDTLFVESSKNYTLPEWTKDVFPGPMLEPTLFDLKLSTWNQKLARLATGLLFQEMIQSMEDKIRNKITKNIHVYSAHDQTIANFLIPLGVFNNISPPYASCVMLELAVNSAGSHFVSLYYRNSTSDEPYQLTVEGCTQLCPLDTFISITQPLIPQDYDEECRVDKANNTLLFIVLGLAIVLIVVVLFILALYFYFTWTKVR